MAIVGAADSSGCAGVKGLAVLGSSRDGLAAALGRDATNGDGLARG
jgi:hypothetical protein